MAPNSRVTTHTTNPHVSGKKMAVHTVCTVLYTLPLQSRVFTIYLTSLGSLTLVRVSVSGRAAASSGAGAGAAVAASRAGARAGLSSLSLVDDDGHVADLELSQLQGLSQRLGVVEVHKRAVAGLGKLTVREAVADLFERSLEHRKV